MRRVMSICDLQGWVWRILDVIDMKPVTNHVREFISSHGCLCITVGHA